MAAMPPSPNMYLSGTRLQEVRARVQGGRGRRVWRVATTDETTRVEAPPNGKAAGTSPKELVEFIKRTAVRMGDFKFTHLPGTWPHTSVPADAMDGRALFPPTR